MTSREREIFDLLVDGVSPKEIAHKLNISLSTVDFHRTKLYRKLGVHSIQELLAKYSANNDKAPEPEAVISVSGTKKQSIHPTSAEIIPAYNLGFYGSTDKEIGGNSAAEVYVTREEIDGMLIDSVLNIKINMAEMGGEKEYAQAYTSKFDIIKRLWKADGIRFKAKGDGKSWFLELKTIESKQEIYWVNYLYEFGTIRDQVIVIDVPYSSLYLPGWAQKDYYFDFNKETINGLDICTKPFKPEDTSFFLQIFDFEIY
jgi:Response regulator containing a CheY-like receiver domain and an HTH DNA-binding domain